MKMFIGKNCTPCKNVKAWLEGKDITVEFLIAEDNMDLARELGVKSLPTLILDDSKLIKGEENIIEYFKQGEENE